MPRQRHSAEEIITKLREAEILQSRGETLAQVCRAFGITQQTCYRRRKEYGGLNVDQVKHLKQLEKENARRKNVVADQALDMAILEEVAVGNV